MITSAAFMLCFLLVLHNLRKFFKQCNMILPPIQLKIAILLLRPLPFYNGFVLNLQNSQINYKFYWHLSKDSIIMIKSVL